MDLVLLLLMMLLPFCDYDNIIITMDLLVALACGYDFLMVLFDFDDFLIAVYILLWICDDDFL